MLSKPSSCKGCPLYGDGKGFVPDEPTDGAEVLVLAQNPGANEESGERIVGYEYSGRRRVPLTEPCQPAPLLGATGYEMERNYFPQAGLRRGENVSLANVLKCRLIVNGKRTNDLPKGKVLTAAVEHCTRNHLKIPPSTKLVVAMGALSAAFTGCPGSIHDWRGFTYDVSRSVQTVGDRLLENGRAQELDRVDATPETPESLGEI